MTDPQTVSEAFLKWMEDNGYGEFEENIFLNQVPDYVDKEDEGQEDVPVDNAFWLVTAGGDVSSLNVTRESIQLFNVTVNYRNKSGEDVERILFALNQQVNSRTVLTLEPFDLYSISASMPEDNDKDVENRRQGFLVVAIEIYVS